VVRVHFHAYTWVGGKVEMEKRSGERWVASPSFAGSPIPPETTRDWLRKPARVIVETFTDPAEAARWFGEFYRANPDGGSPAEWISPERKEGFALGELSGGNDAVLGYYTRNGGYVSANLLCCPREGYPCPAPVASAA
jgi:hypothetical protein